MYCSTIQPFICACFFWKTEEKQALTWQRIAAHMEGEAVNRSVNTGQPVVLLAPSTALHRLPGVPGGRGPAACSLSPVFMGAPGNWLLSSWLPGRHSAGASFSPSVLSSFSAGPPRTLGTRTSFLFLGTHFVWPQG